MRFVLLTLSFTFCLFIYGTTVQKWSPETSCLKKGTPEEYCKTETVDFWHTNADEFFSFGDGNGDVTNYLRIAKYFLGELEFTDQVRWSSHNWSPGVPAIIAVLIKFTGKEHYFPKMLLVSCLMISIALTLLFQQINPQTMGRRTLVWIGLFLPFVLFPDLRFQTLQFGYVASEALSVSFFILTLIAAYRALKNQSLSAAVIAGVALAAMTYMRAMLDSLQSVTMTLLMLFGVGLFLYSKVSKNLDLKKQAVSYLKIWLVVFSTYQVLVYPWKDRNRSLTGDFSFCTTTYSTFLIHWMPNHLVPPWIPTTNVPCRTNPELCRELDTLPEKEMYSLKKNMTLVYFALNPFKWYAYRIQDFNKLWTGMGYRPNGLWDIAWYRAWFEGIFGFIASLSFGVFYFRKKSSLTPESKNLVNKLFLLAGCFVAGNLMMFTFVSYEHRYSLYLRTALWIFPLLGYLSLRPNSSKSEQQG